MKSAPSDINQDRYNVGNQRNRQDKFPEFARTPCPLQVLPSVKEGRAVDQEGEDVLLDKGRREESPRVVEDFGRNKRQVWDYRGVRTGHLHGRRQGIDCPPSRKIVEEGEGDEDD